MRSMIMGRVTSIGLDISPRMKEKRVRMYNTDFRFTTYSAYRKRVRNQKKALSTSFRSATHATDSTCIGWSANKVATSELCQSEPVKRSRRSKRSTEVAV
jgi:hypothetical protein